MRAEADLSHPPHVCLLGQRKKNLSQKGAKGLCSTEKMAAWYDT